MKIKERAQQFWSNHKFLIGVMVGSLVTGIVGELTAKIVSGNGEYTWQWKRIPGETPYDNKSIAEIKTMLATNPTVKKIYDGISIDYTDKPTEVYFRSTVLEVPEIISAE